MTEDSIILVAGRRRGRPRAVQRMSTVTAHVPEAQHDALVSLATARRESVSATLARFLADGLRRETQAGISRQK